MISGEELMEDPSRCSVQRAAACGIVVLPWTNVVPLSLGCGFSSELAGKATANPFHSTAIAFSDYGLANSSIVYHPNDNCTGTYISSQTSSSRSSSDHMSLSLGVSIGNDYLGASVTGSYDKSVSENRSADKISRRTAFQAGAVHFVRPPALSEEAKELLSSPTGGLDAFLNRYGNFYVSALGLGGDAGVLITQDSSSYASSERAKIEGEAHVLCFSDTETLYEKDWSEAKSRIVLGVTAFDTLDQAFVDVPLADGQGIAFEDARKFAREYSERIDKMPSRVKRQLDRLGEMLDPLGRLKWKDVRVITQSGLISRLVLSPFVTHRDVRPYAFNLDAAHLPKNIPAS